VKTWSDSTKALPFYLRQKLNGVGIYNIAVTAPCFRFLISFVSFALLFSASAQTTLNTGDPVGFFTTIANKMLLQTFGFGVTNIPVYSNGVSVYTPSVQRLLQLSANIYDASTTNFYPTVFRPLFSVDQQGNVFITGYTNLNSPAGINTVSGASDLQLSTPFDVATISQIAPGPVSPMVNIYGVPWIIGVKMGFPNFNEFAMDNVVQLNRKLEIQRANFNYPPKFNYTNVSYVFSIGSSLGVEFWNSYTNSYAKPVQVVLNGSLWMTLTNGDPFSPYQYIFPVFTNMFVPAWSNVAPYSFVCQTTNVAFITNQAYLWGGGFAQSGQTIWQTGGQFLPMLPQFGLLITNRLQAYMLDGNHVIDYVQLNGPGSSRNLNTEIQSSLGYALSYVNMWTTNLDKNGRQISINNQIEASLDSPAIPINPTFWPGEASPQAWEIDGFWVFMGGSPGALPMYLPPAEVNAYNGYFSNLTHQVPFTPTVTVYDYTTWQANDPLVHYLGSDLNFSQIETKPASGVNPPNYHGVTNFFGTLPNIGLLNARYAPWGKLRVFAGSDNNRYNLAYKDPLVTSADNWNFPSGNGFSLNTLGQVHRGTPWQTVFLKATNIFNLNNPAATGLNTWTNWTGDYDANDAKVMAPFQDWRLASLLADLFNTNDISTLFSVNNPNQNDWQGLLDGMTVFTDTDTNPQFVTISSNSVQAAIVANAIESTRCTQPGQIFSDLGDILGTLELSESSPFLDPNQLTNGISDEAYEMIPSQLLPLLRSDSIGSVLFTNNQMMVQFTGYDGYFYIVQSSSDLRRWTNESINSPSQGHFTVVIPTPTSTRLFYRSVLLPLTTMKGNSWHSYGRGNSHQKN
jgi:hypothetical protein